MDQRVQQLAQIFRAMATPWQPNAPIPIGYAPTGTRADADSLR